MNTLTTQIQNKIRKDMIYGYRNENGEKQYPKLTEAAKWYKVSYGSLKQYARKWDWKQKREDHIRKVARKVAEKKESEEISESEAEEIVVNDAKFNDAANKLRRAVANEIDKILNGKNIQSMGYQLMNLGKALESAQKVSKTAAGEPSEYTESQVKGEVNGRYEVTKSLICSDEHIEHEMRLLNAAGKAQGTTD